MLSYKKFVSFTLAFVGLCSILIISLVYIIDPFFHYRAPTNHIPYALEVYNQRSQNNGITRHFEYDAIITGTSLTANFQASQMDALFGTKSIKVPFNGATFYEINQVLERTISYNPDIKMIVRGLETSGFSAAADELRYWSYPDYLYDENMFNDINYLLNKDTIVRGFSYIALNVLKGNEMTTFDEYSSWRQMKFGKDIAISNYSRPEKNIEQIHNMTEEDNKTVYENTMQNVINLADKNPDIDFYYCYLPRSVLFYDSLNQLNQLPREFEIVEYATSMIVQQENIMLFSFIELFDIVSDLDNYRDTQHYTGEINDLMMDYMYQGEYIWTEDNYQERMEVVREFYLNYDYDGIFE